MRTSACITVLILLVCYSATAQTGWEPRFHGVYMDILLAPPVPAIGAGLEYDILVEHVSDSSITRDAMGLHLGLEYCVSSIAPMSNKTEMRGLDSDILLYYRKHWDRLSVILLVGWSNRNLDKWNVSHTSGRLKYGAVVSYCALRGGAQIDIRLKAMLSSLGRSYVDAELAPASIGISVGLYDW